MSLHWIGRSRGMLWIGGFIGLIGLMSLIVRAQDDEPRDADDSRERLVFLVTGRMLTGQVHRNAGGYLVEQPNGRVQVAKEDVKFIVNDLREAYRKQRDSVVEPTPATHVALANWCIAYRLLDEARDELKICLKSDPNHEEARRLLQRLTDTIRADQPVKPPELLPARTADGYLQPAVESLGRLSRESALQFTSRVQPLLLNKCGNASCHGTAAKTEFRLTFARTQGAGTRQNSEQNLAQVMKYIDINNLADSALLSATKGAHGGKGALFIGQVGAEQQKTIRTWAKTVALEKQAEQRELEQMPKLTGKRGSKYRVVQTSAVAEEETTDIEPTRSAFGGDQSSAGKPTKIPRELKADPTDAKALAMEPDDPFDPEEFNRRFGKP